MLSCQPAQVKSRASYLGISSIQSHGTFPGIIIVGIAPDSPALKAGLQPNDVLTSFDGNDLGNVTPPDFARFVQKMPPGAQAKVEYVRQAVKNSTIITIEAKP